MKGGRFWFAAALAESGAAALLLARLALGPPTQAGRPALWAAAAFAILATYLAIALWTISCLRRIPEREDGGETGRLAVATLPFLAGYLAQLALLQFRPDLGGWPTGLLSPLQPFPAVAVGLAVLAALLVKTLVVALYLRRAHAAQARLARATDIAIPAALLLMGVLQASVYLIPFGAISQRYWAIADAMAMGLRYPAAITEPLTVAAGGPPYIYDLPLFPLLLWASFSLLGHDTAAAHVPAALFNALFPLSIYLLIREMTRSRVVALLFATLAALFPYLRLWVLNQPDPDPMMATSACLAAYLYLRALADPRRWLLWAVAGATAGLLGVTRPEGILYAGFLTLGVLASRPRFRQLGQYILGLGLVLVPTAALWLASFGFLWPQNYFRTLHPAYLQQNLDNLAIGGALAFYQAGLGLDAPWATALLALFVAAASLGTVAMALRDRRLLPIAIPGIGNTLSVFFLGPGVANSYHFADFFRHLAPGLPFLVATAAYGLHIAGGWAAGRRGLAVFAYVAPLLLAAAVAREGDILANPTPTHRPGGTQVLTGDPYLALQTIRENPMPLPRMEFYWDSNESIARVPIPWPETPLAFFEPLGMSFDSRGRPFGYASVVAFLLALGFALLAEGPPFRGRPGP